MSVTVFRNKLIMTTRKRFSSFTLAEALELIKINQFQEWLPDVKPVKPSAFYQTTYQKLKNHFDLSLSEAAKSLLIDAILLEAITPFEQLKIWKEAALKTDNLIGTLDYLLAQQGKIYKKPLLCVVEAKKDDFEKSLAQCLVEMYVCHQYNQNMQNDIYGIITNASVWRFYQFSTQQQIYETPVYAETQLEIILGVLQFIFKGCAKTVSKGGEGAAS